MPLSNASSTCLKASLKTSLFRICSASPALRISLSGVRGCIAHLLSFEGYGVLHHVLAVPMGSGKVLLRGVVRHLQDIDAHSLEGEDHVSNQFLLVDGELPILLLCGR